MCSRVNFTRPFLLGAVFFRTDLPYSGGCRLERGGVPLSGAVGMSCGRGVAAEGQGSGVGCVGWGVYLGDCVCVLTDLT